MIIYRPQRGTLAESMSEKKEFKTESDMKDYIVIQWDGLFEKEDIVIDNKEVNDKRIGWTDTKLVCVKKIGTEDYMKLYGVPQCIGYCATNYKID
jgi:hypothetical protein